MDKARAADDDLDRALVRQYLDGEPAAGDELVNRHVRRMYNVALRMLGNVQDAEDVTQTAFGNAFAALGTYDPNYRFFSWIYRMTVNASLNTLKRRRDVVSFDGSFDPPVADAGDSAVEAGERVGQALLTLTPGDRAVIVLRHLEALSYEEIAEALGLPVKTVKSRLFTARLRLRQALLDGRV